MGYLCPVCEEPFGGGEPLADHLALTAILHAGDHETWLNEAVGDWEEVSRADLAERVVENAEPADGHDHPGEQSHVDVASERSSGPDGVDIDAMANAGMDGGLSGSGPFSAVDSSALDPEAQAILEEATAYTRAMAGEGDDESVAPDAEGKES